MLFQAMETGLRRRGPTRSRRCSATRARRSSWCRRSRPRRPTRPRTSLEELARRNCHLGARRRQPHAADRAASRAAATSAVAGSAAAERRRRVAAASWPTAVGAAERGVARGARRGRASASTTSRSSPGARPSGGPSWPAGAAVVPPTSPCARPRRQRPRRPARSAITSGAARRPRLAAWPTDRADSQAPVWPPSPNSSREHTSLTASRVGHLQRLVAGVGHARRLLLRRPAAVRAGPTTRRPLARRRRPGPPGHQPDALPHRLGGHVADRVERPLLAAVVRRSGEIIEGDDRRSTALRGAGADAGASRCAATARSSPC